MNQSNRKKSVAVSKNKNQIKPYSNLVTARTGLFYGLVYKKQLRDTVSVTSSLNATPNVIFNSGQTGAFFDFSDWKNEETTEKSFYDFWKLVSSGASFTVSNGELYSEKNDKLYNVSGTYTLNEIENMVVIANVTSVQNIDTNINLYSKLNFKNTPIFTLSSSPQTGDSTTTTIINTFGSNSKISFSYLGASIGDYILFQENLTPYEILETNEDSEGREILVVRGEIPEENRIGTKTLIQLMIKVPPKQESLIDQLIIKIPPKEETLIDQLMIKVPPKEESIKPDLQDTAIGSCKLIENNIIINCYNNQTKDQCALRKKGNITTTFLQNQDCAGLNLFQRVSKTSTVSSTNDETIARLLRDISSQVSSNNRAGKIF
jgi:hypothetical protein